jgi:hypothetical protein
MLFKNNRNAHTHGFVVDKCIGIYASTILMHDPKKQPKILSIELSAGVSRLPVLPSEKAKAEGNNIVVIISATNTMGNIFFLNIYKSPIILEFIYFTSSGDRVIIETAEVPWDRFCLFAKRITLLRWQVSLGSSVFVGGGTLDSCCICCTCGVLRLPLTAFF